MIDQIKRMKQTKDLVDKQMKAIEDMSNERDKAALPFEAETKDLQAKMKAIEKKPS